MVTICATSDLHGRIDKYALFVEQMKKLKPDILIDNGDFLQGSLPTFYYEYIQKQRHPMIDMANDIGLDALVFGNHEFNYPVSSIRDREAESNFPWISSNIGAFAKPYIIKTVKGKRIAIIGATTMQTPAWDEQQFTNNITFERATKHIEKWVEYVREIEGVHFVIVCYHGGFSESITSNMPFTADPAENEANEILRLKGIDVLITGHQHLEICTTVNDIVVVQPGANGDCYVQINWQPENGEISARLLPLSGHISFPREVNEWLEEEIGYAEDDFRFEGLLASRLGSHPYVNWVHRVQLEQSRADISIVDLLYAQEGGFYKKITNFDILKTNARPNVLMKTLLSGQEILTFLEQIAATFEVNEQGMIDFSYHVRPQDDPPFLYFYVGGLQYEMNVSRPIGERVVTCNFQGKTLDPTRLYSVCLNSYLATGADFELFKHKEMEIVSETIIPLLLIDAIKRQQTIFLPQSEQFTIYCDAKIMQSR